MRLLLSICISLLAVSLPVLAALYRVAGFSPSVVTLLISDGLLLLNIALLRRASPRLVGAILCIEMLVSFSLIAVSNSGLESASWLWTLTIPVVAAFVVGARFGLFCALLLIVDVFGFYALELRGHEFGPPETGTSHSSFIVLGLTTATGFLALLAALYERLRHRAERAQAQFLANMSHEIRTPMNAIVGLSDLLLRGELHDREREYVEIIGTSATNLLGVLSDILDLTMMEADTLRVDLEPLALRPCLEGVVSMMRPIAEQKGLSLELDVETECEHPVMGDPLRLRQVLVNLVGNAVKFTDSGVVRVSAKMDQGGARSVSFEVADTGSGVDPKNAHKLFQPFERGAANNSRVGGVGLGLAICKRLVDLMGGTMGVRANRPQGSVFHFAIPHVPAPRQPTHHHQIERQGPEKLHRNFVALLADDEPVNLLVASELLRTMGGEVVCVSDGAAALATCESRRFDLIFLDCRMPEIDGYEVATRLRSEGSPQTCPIIALTASAMKGDRERCLAAGMDDYLTKPVQSDELRAAVGRWLEPASPSPNSNSGS